VLRMKITIQKD